MLYSLIKSIKNKLNNENGVSILFGLLAFLVAAMVSTTIVVAAVTSMKRVAANSNNQRAKLALTSATGLIKNCFESDKLTIIKTEKVIKGEDGAPDKTETDYKAEDENVAFSYAIIEALKDPATYKEPQEIGTITFGTNNPYKIDDVDVKMSVETIEKDGKSVGCRLKFVMECETGSDEEKSKMNSATISYSSTATASGDTNEAGKTKTIITWGEPVITNE